MNLRYSLRCIKHRRPCALIGCSHQFLNSRKLQVGLRLHIPLKYTNRSQLSSNMKKTQNNYQSLSKIWIHLIFLHSQQFASVVIFSVAIHWKVSERNQLKPYMCLDNATKKGRLCANESVNSKNSKIPTDRHKWVLQCARAAKKY